MNVHKKARLGIIGLLFVCILAIPAMATTLTVGSGTIPAAGQSAVIVITGDTFPDGLFGYDITASFSDPSIAEITAVSFPSWDTQGYYEGTLPSTSLLLMGFPVRTASTNLPLVTLTVRGKAPGSTSLNLAVTDMVDTTNGLPITPTIVPGTIVVGGAPTTGSIAVTSSPAGAAITLDSTGTGQVTPYTFTSQTPGPHTVDVSLAGYQTASHSVTVSAGTTVSSHFTLVPVSPTTGSITVTSSPAGAAITLDSTGTGQVTPYTFASQTPGPHTVDVSLAGYQTASQTVTVSAGTTVSSHFTLVPVSPTTGSLYITSSPTGATVTIDGTEDGTTPVTVLGLSPGSHSVTLSLTGYQTASQTVTVSAGTTVSSHFTLVPVSPTTGSLYITSSPTGATVTIDGMVDGTTPVAVLGLSPGSHSVTLSMVGYQTYSGSATVTASEETPVNVVLTPEGGGTPGYLTVYSFPLKATAAIDGTVVGKTPLMGTRVNPGTHTLTIGMTGYSDYTTSINVAAGSHLQLPLIILQRGSSTPGSLSVTSSPSGATLMVDGTGYGPTPVVVPGLSPGSHSIILSMAGYQTYSGSATVTAGIETPVNIVLVPVSPTTGSLSVTSNPTGATVMVDGTGYGPTPVVVPGLSPGSHSISISKAGYQAYSGSASVTAGSETPVFVVLTQVSPSPTTTTPAGDTGAVKINTVPRGVSVYLDNQMKGVTPVTIQGLSQRSYELKLIKQGFRTQVKTIQIQPGQTLTLPLIIMTPL